MLKFDRAGNELARYEVPVELSGLVLATLTGRGGLEVYAGDSSGFLHVLDADLGPVDRMPITARTHDWIYLRAELAGDLDGDGRPELVLQSAQVEFISGTSLGHPEGGANVRHYHGHSLHFYDARLKPRDELPADPICHDYARRARRRCRRPSPPDAAADPPEGRSKGSRSSNSRADRGGFGSKGT